MKIMVNGKSVSPRGRGKEMKAYTTKYFKIAGYKFDNTLYNLFPAFNEGFEYTYEDIVEGNITTRTIYSNDLPTLLKFGREDMQGEPRELSLLEVLYVNTENIIDMSSMFINCFNVVSINAANWDTSNVTNMQSLFSSCRSLMKLDLSNWDTSSVINMSYMLSGCIGLTELDVSNWNTSNVINMSYMFNNCPLLASLDVSSFNTSKTTNMTHMFNGCKQLTSLDVSSFNTSNVTNMIAMFANLNLVSLDLSNFNTSNVIDMVNMFIYSGNLIELNLNNWDLNKVTNMSGIFNDTKLKTIIMNNSDYSSINKIINKLPTRTTENPGTLDIAGVYDISLVNLETLNNKYWNIISHTILNNAKLSQTKLN